MLQEAFLAVDTDLMQQLRSVRLDDRDGHTRLVMALQISEAVRKHLWLLMQDGAAARETIQLRGKRLD